MVYDLLRSLRFDQQPMQPAFSDVPRAEGLSPCQTSLRLTFVASLILNPVRASAKQDSNND